MNQNEYRMKLWCDVYVARASVPDAIIDNVEVSANKSVEAFDKAFSTVTPAPKMSNDYKSYPDDLHIVRVTVDLVKYEKLNAAEKREMSNMLELTDGRAALHQLSYLGAAKQQGTLTWTYKSGPTTSCATMDRMIDEINATFGTNIITGYTKTVE